MGVFATFETDTVSAQIKTWNEGIDFRAVGMPTLRLGDAVPALDKLGSTYSIKLREGGYLNVFDNTLASHTNEPASDRVFDKWGQTPPTY